MTPGSLGSKAENYASVVSEQQVLIERDETPVMFKRVADEANAISRGMAEVEESVGLRGRKYYGSSSARATIRRHLGSRLAHCLGAGMRGCALLASRRGSTS
jgi:hypothetical protein